MKDRSTGTAPRDSSGEDRIERRQQGERRKYRRWAVEGGIIAALLYIIDRLFDLVGLLVAKVHAFF